MFSAPVSTVGLPMGHLGKALNQGRVWFPPRSFPSVVGQLPSFITNLLFMEANLGDWRDYGMGAGGLTNTHIHHWPGPGSNAVFGTLRRELLSNHA